MKYLVNIIIIFFLPFQVFSLDSINLELLNHAKSVDQSETDLNKIVHQLSTITKTDKEKAEIFCYWIAENIDYDVENFLSEIHINTNPLITKKGVCQDYAELYEQMCSLADITCFIVDGYAKGFFLPGDTLNFDKSNHVWNIVKLENKYYNVDVTWSSGHTNYVNKKLIYVRNINVSNILTNAITFNETHLPADPVWQLNDSIISIKSFARYRDYKDMMKIPFSYNYNYLDSLAHFVKFNSSERDMNSILRQYQFNERFKNRKQLISNYSYYFHKYIEEVKSKEKEELLKAVFYMNQGIQLSEPLIDLAENAKEQYAIKQKIVDFYNMTAYHLSMKGTSKQELKQAIEIYSKAYDLYEDAHDYFKEEGLELVHQTKLKAIKDNLTYTKIQYQLARLKVRRN